MKIDEHGNMGEKAYAEAVRLLVGKTISRVYDRPMKLELILEFTDGSKVAFGGSDQAGAIIGDEVTDQGDLEEALELAGHYANTRNSGGHLSDWACENYAKEIDVLVGFSTPDGRFCWPTAVCDKAEVKTNWRRP